MKRAADKPAFLFSTESSKNNQPSKTHLDLVVVLLSETPDSKPIPIPRVRLLTPSHSVDTPWGVIRVNFLAPAAPAPTTAWLCHLHGLKQVTIPILFPQSAVLSLAVPFGLYMRRPHSLLAESLMTATCVFLARCCTTRPVQKLLDICTKNCCTLSTACGGWSPLCSTSCNYVGTRILFRRRYPPLFRSLPLAISQCRW